MWTPGGTSSLAWGKINYLGFFTIWRSIADDVSTFLMIADRALALFFKCRLACVNVLFIHNHFFKLFGFWIIDRFSLFIFGLFDSIGYGIRSGGNDWATLQIKHGGNDYDWNYIFHNRCDSNSNDWFQVANPMPCLGPGVFAWVLSQFHIGGGSVTG